MPISFYYYASEDDPQRAEKCKGIKSYMGKNYDISIVKAGASYNYHYVLQGLRFCSF
jgi:hypothetical protein